MTPGRSLPTTNHEVAPADEAASLPVRKQRVRLEDVDVEAPEPEPLGQDAHDAGLSAIELDRSAPEGVERTTEVFVGRRAGRNHADRGRRGSTGGVRSHMSERAWLNCTPVPNRCRLVVSDRRAAGVAGRD